MEDLEEDKELREGVLIFKGSRLQSNTATSHTCHADPQAFEKAADASEAGDDELKIGVDEVCSIDITTHRRQH